MSGGRFFLDTNIFVYTFDPVATAKAKTAEDLIGVALRDHRGVISFQIGQEFCATALRTDNDFKILVSHPVTHLIFVFGLARIAQDIRASYWVF